MQRQFLTKLDFIRHPALSLVYGIRVNVPKGAKKVYIPRKKHYAPKVYTEENDYKRLEAFYDVLEPCVVKKGVFGWKPHRCPYHPMVVIQEK